MKDPKELTQTKTSKDKQTLTRVLPNEMLLKIFNELDTPSLAQLSRTDTILHHYAQGIIDARRAEEKAKIPPLPASFSLHSACDRIPTKNRYKLRHDVKKEVHRLG